MYLFHSFHFWLQHLFALEYAFVFLPAFHYCYHWAFFDLHELEKKKESISSISAISQHFLYARKTLKARRQSKVVSISNVIPDLKKSRNHYKQRLTPPRKCSPFSPTSLSGTTMLQLLDVVLASNPLADSLSQSPS